MNNPFELIEARLSSIENLILDLKYKYQPNQVGPSINPNERLSRKQVRQEYNISLSTIHSLMNSGKLPYEKVGRKTLFRREDVERCFTNNMG